MRLERCTSLLVDLRHGEVLRFDDAGIEVALVHKSGRLARLHVRAPVGQGIRHEHGPQLGERGVDDRTVPALLGRLQDAVGVDQSVQDQKAVIASG